MWEQLKEIRWNKSGVAACVWLDPLASGLPQEPGPRISPIGASVMETEGSEKMFPGAGELPATCC